MLGLRKGAQKMKHVGFLFYFKIYFILMAAVSLLLLSVRPTTAECVDVPSEKETTDNYTEYKEVVDPSGCHFLVYVHQWNDPKEGWLERGWLLHRKNCPCGWNTQK